MNKKDIKNNLLITFVVVFLIFDFILFKDIFLAKNENTKQTKNEIVSTENPISSDKKLYPVYKMKKDYVVFIDKYGKPVFEVSLKDYDVIGEYNEGRVFLGKSIKKRTEEDTDGEKINIPEIVRYFVFDNRGNKIVTIKPDIEVDYNMEDGSIITPFFENGRATIYCKDDKNFDVDVNGNELSSVRNLSETQTSKYFENIRVYYNESGTKYGYITNNGEIIVPPTFEPPPPGYDYWDPNFSNGVALMKLNGKFGYINKKGQYIIKPTLEYAQSFSNQCYLFSSFGSAYIIHDLAYIIKDTKEGYINTKGEFVWSITRKDQQ